MNIFEQVKSMRRENETM